MPRTTGSAEQIGAVEQLHREEAGLVGDDELVERDQVRMREIRERPELALELIDLLDVGIAIVLSATFWPRSTSSTS